MYRSTSPLEIGEGKNQFRYKKYYTFPLYYSTRLTNRSSLKTSILDTIPICEDLYEKETD
jgi:hypothetical protein